MTVKELENNLIRLIADENHILTNGFHTAKSVIAKKEDKDMWVEIPENSTQSS